MSKPKLLQMGPTSAFSLTQTAGVADYKELVSAGLAGNASDNFYDPTTQASWIYDGTNLYTGDTPQSIAAKTTYIKNNSLAGAMMFSLDGEDSGDTLLNAIANGLPGSYGGGGGGTLHLRRPLARHQQLRRPLVRHQQLRRPLAPLLHLRLRQPVETWSPMAALKPAL